MRISDWSSDVCSSDLQGAEAVLGGLEHAEAVLALPGLGAAVLADPRHARPVYVAGIPISHATRFHSRRPIVRRRPRACHLLGANRGRCRLRSEEHTYELQSLMRISYAVFCLKY